MAGAGPGENHNMAGNSDFTRKAMKLASEMPQPDGWASPRASDGSKGSPEQKFSGGGIPLASQAYHWPTPMAHDTHLGDPERVGRFGTAHGGRNLTDEASAWQTPGTDSFRSRGGDRKDEMGLDQQARRWPTPDASTANDREQPDTWRARQERLKVRCNNGNGAGVPLTIAAQEMAQAQWPTPTVQNEKGAGGNREGGPNLQTEVVAWPTPAARDYRATNSEESQEARQERGFTSGQQLPNFVRHNWPTPMTSDDGDKATRASNQTMLCNVAADWDSSSPPAPEIRSGPRSLQPIPFSPLPSPSSTSGPLLEAISDFRRWSERSGGAAGWRGTWIRSPRRALNPRFVELLMGWAVGWTGSEPVGMGFFHWRQLSLIYLSGLNSPRIEQQGSLF
jgi:hypothetical protein